MSTPRFGLSTLQWRYLQFVSLVCVLFSVRDLHADEPILPAVAPPPPYVPVIMTEVSGDVGGEVQAKLLEALSRSLQRASLSAFAERVYGTGAEFATPERTGGPLSMFGSVMKDFDAYFETEVAAVAQSAPTGNYRVSVEALLAKPSAQIKPAVDRASGHPLRMLWQVGRVAASDSLTASQVNLLDNITGLAVVSKNDLADGGQSLYDQGKEVYEWMATDKQAKFLPLYERMTLDINNGAVSLSFDVYIKPGTLYKGGFNNEGKVFATRDFTYQPPFFSDRPAMMRLRFTRTYGGNNGQRPLLALDFGRMFSNDIRGMNNCVSDCKDEIWKVPTIAIDLQPSVINARLAPLGGANGFFSSMKQNVTNYFRASLVDFVNWTQEETEEHTRFFILLNSLVIDLTDPSGPAIRPDFSQTPVVLRVTTPYTADRNYMTFNPFNTTVTVETDLSYLRLGVGKIGGSINLFEKYLGPPIAGGLTPELRNNLRNLDRASDEYMSTVLAPVTDLINY